MTWQQTESALARQSIRLSTLGLLAAVVLSACSFIPEYQRPALPTAPAYPGTATQPQEAAPPLAQWPAFFGDPELRRLIERSLVNNRDLRIAVQRVAQARAAYGIQRSEQFPSVDLRAGGIHLDLPDDLALTRRNPFTAYNVNLGLSWELDLWGRVRSLKEAALQSYLATDDARRAITLSLMAQVANAYLNARELDERIARTRVAGEDDRAVGRVEAEGESRPYRRVIDERCRDLHVVVGHDDAVVANLMNVHERHERHASFV